MQLRTFCSENPNPEKLNIPKLHYEFRIKKKHRRICRRFYARERVRHICTTHTYKKKIFFFFCQRVTFYRTNKIYFKISAQTQCTSAASSSRLPRAVSGRTSECTRRSRLLHRAWYTNGRASIDEPYS